MQGFLGVRLEKGDYTIKLVYRCPGFLEGAAATLLGILLFWGFCTLERRKRVTEGNTEQKREVNADEEK